MKRLVGASTAVFCTVLLAACTGGSSPRAAGSPSPSSPSAAAAAPTTAVVVPPAGEQVLGQLESQRGTRTLGPYPVTFDAIAVYAVCVGRGQVDVSIPGVGAFPQSCDPRNPEPFRNTFDVRFVTSVTVQVQGDDSLMWGVSLTGLPVLPKA